MKRKQELEILISAVSEKLGDELVNFHKKFLQKKAHFHKLVIRV